jgi:TfoX/Sxy family transcriptional regulator of competence genes
MAFDEELADRIRELVQAEDGVIEKRMFGGLAFIVGGHMAVAASSKGGLMVRVEPARTEEFEREPHAGRFEMRGRGMAGWLQVDPDGLETDEQLGRWVRLGVGHARSLPPK